MPLCRTLAKSVRIAWCGSFGTRSTYGWKLTLATPPLLDGAMPLPWTTNGDCGFLEALTLAMASGEIRTAFTSCNSITWKAIVPIHICSLILRIYETKSGRSAFFWRSCCSWCEGHGSHHADNKSFVRCGSEIQAPNFCHSFTVDFLVFVVNGCVLFFCRGIGECALSLLGSGLPASHQVKSNTWFEGQYKGPGAIVFNGRRNSPLRLKVSSVFLMSVWVQARVSWCGSSFVLLGSGLLPVMPNELQTLTGSRDFNRDCLGLSLHFSLQVDKLLFHSPKGAKPAQW